MYWRAVQSIASQTLRQSGSLEGFKAAFQWPGLHALAGGARPPGPMRGWAGSDMRQLVRRTLGTVSLPVTLADGSRWTVPRLTLRTQNRRRG